MLYAVIIPKRVQKELNGIDFRYQSKIKLALVKLAQDPFIGKKLEGKYKDQRSLCVWPYRIIYEIGKQELFILIIRIKHRQGVYKF